MPSAPLEQKVRAEEVVVQAQGLDQEIREVLARVTASNMAGFSSQTLKTIDKNKARLKAFENTPFAKKPFWKLASKDERIALFQETMAQVRGDALYHAMHEDSDIRKHALEGKTFAEMNKFGGIIAPLSLRKPLIIKTL